MRAVESFPPGDARVVESSIHLPDERIGPSPRLMGRGPAGLELSGLLVSEVRKDAVAPQIPGDPRSSEREEKVSLKAQPPSEDVADVVKAGGLARATGVD